MAAINDTTFPPLAWLGHGLDLTQLTPLDIDTVTKKVLKAFRTIELSKTGSSQTQSQVTWTIPDNVDFSGDVATGEC
jgi:hypothetical protein